jgi:16S rRNA (guanine(966)-N(2))-methyltransferase RsmD
MTRIVAGDLGGRRISAPPGRETRPTSDRVREALFSTLESQIDLSGCRFVDLYAGSGAVGLEAASRGAAAVLLVESDARAARTIRANITALDLGAKCELAVGRLPAALNSAPKLPYDVVFADPPYELPEPDVTELLRTLVARHWLAADTVVVLERSARSPEPARVEGVTSERGRRYGESMLWYLRAS